MSAEEQPPVPAAPNASKTPASRLLDQPIRADLALREQTGFGERLNQFLARAGIALGLTAGASHMAGTKAEGMVGEAFEPIHDTLRPGDDGADDAQRTTERDPQNLLERARGAYHSALEWSADVAKETELIQKIDQTFTDLEKLSKDIAYWGAFVVTFMTLMSLLTAYLAVRKLAGKKPVDPRVEAQIRTLAEAVNQMGERLHALQTQPQLPAPQDRDELLAGVGTAVKLVEALKSS